MVATVRHHAGQLVLEYQYPSTTAPVLIGVRWPIVDAKRTGPFAPELADGLVVSYRQSDRWQAYAQGDYLIVHSAHEGTPMTDQPIVCPKVRKGIETRYYCGRWEKYSKRDGWIGA